MLNTSPLDVLPIWGVYLLTMLVLYLSIEVGFRSGLHIEKRWPDHSEAGVGTIVGASLAFLGFLLALITSAAMNIFNERRILVVNEANAIGTTYLQAEYLPEPYSENSRKLLREYVDMRIAVLQRDKRDASIARAEEIHQELWSQVIPLVKASPDPTTALYVSSLNEVIDIHSERYDIQLYVRIPPTILMGLYLVGMFTMLLIGMQASYSGKRNILSLVMLVTILSLVFMLITDLERSSQGLIQVSQQPLSALQEQLRLYP
jgi:hypothetical protein